MGNSIQQIQFAGILFPLVVLVVTLVVNGIEDDDSEWYQAFVLCMSLAIILPAINGMVNIVFAPVSDVYSIRNTVFYVGSVSFLTGVLVVGVLMYEFRTRADWDHVAYVIGTLFLMIWFGYLVVFVP